MANFLGVDWGGTYIKLGVVSKEGKVKLRRVLPSQELCQKDLFINKITDLVERFRGYRLKAIGIGAPGVIDVERGFIYYLPNIKGWRNYPLKEVLERKTNLPVYIDNDANVFTLAESLYGRAKGLKRAIFLTLGTGLGGGLIIEGRVFRGRLSAAELAHLPITKNGRRCGCGARGCIETFVGNRYLERRYKILKRIKNEVSLKEIFKRMSQAEREALSIGKEFVEYLGRFLSGLINIFNPERIIIGGGVSESLSLFKPYLWQVIRHQAMWPNLKGLKIVRAGLKGDAGIIGAALFAQQSLQRMQRKKRV